jgi:hypothetical protein
MNLNEPVKATGQLEIVVRDAQGNVKEQHVLRNLVVTTGRTFIAARMVGTPTAMSHMALGAGGTAAALGDSALGSEAGRVALATGTSASNVVTYTANFPAGTASGAITEAGIFNASSAGTMLCRTVFPVVNKGANDSVGITWAVTIS